MIQLTPELVKKKFDERWEEFTDLEKQTFRQRFVIHDYEIFPNAILLMTLDLATCQYHARWGCRPIRDHVRNVFINNESTVFVGFNNKNFDNMITDAILDGVDSEEKMKEISDALINNSTDDEDSSGFYRWRSGDSGRYRPAWVKRTFDIGFDIGQRKIGPEGNQRKIPIVGLKRWQRLNGIKVYHSDIPFDKPLTEKWQYEETEKYCLYDLLSTAWLLLSGDGWDPCLNARRVLVDEHGDKGVDWVMTKPAITAIVLNAKKENYTPPSNWEDYKFVLPSNIRIQKNRELIEAYTTKTYGELRALSKKGDNPDATGGVVLKDICGLPHVFGVGGVHGCTRGTWFAKGGGIYSVDAASLYPRLMQHYNYLSRCVVGDDRFGFGEMIDLRVNVYKPAGDRRADGLKLVLNGGFGAMGFEQSIMYDPINFHNVTILGQLLLTDLVEKLERHIELIQNNTDGAFFRLRNPTPEGLAECKAIVSAFEKRTHLEMEWTEFERMYQKDVSTYVCRVMPKPGKPIESGKVVVKGGHFLVKYCTSMPYLFSTRVHAALNEGEMLPIDNISMDRFAIEIKRDKNSECFSVDGEPDYRGWLDVVPVSPNSPKLQQIDVICKPTAGDTEPNLFGNIEDDLTFRKRRKATGCPDHSALVENVKTCDIDMSWFAHKLGVPIADDSETIKIKEKRNDTTVNR